jgi:signal transduction histidine kinase
LAVRKELGEPTFILATEPPTLGQRRFAFAVIGVVFAMFGVSVAIGLKAPFARIPVQIDAFVPALAAIVFVNDFITATLLFGQFSIVRSRALLVIASGYLFTAVMAIPFALTFPGAFSPTGLLNAGLQSAAWIYNFWHYGFPLVAIAYAMLRGVDRASTMSRGSAWPAIIRSVAIVLGVAYGLTWLATTGAEFLPHLFLDSIHPTPLARIVTSTNTFICAIALALLYSRRCSVLDLWLMVVLCAWLTELALLDALLFPRFTFGFYVGRGFTLLTSVVVLVVLLAEMTRLYARLARSNMALQRERANKLMNLEAMAVSISHEVRQPLTAIASNGDAGLICLGQASPDIEEARAAFSDIVADSHRVSQVFDNIRALFGRADQRQESIDVNEMALGVLRSLRADLKGHGITTRVELGSGLPLVMGHGGQLQEVFSNLVRNAIEAMDTVEVGNRMLLVRTENRGRDSIAVAVEDSGPGIAPEKVDCIFDAFVTTKSNGMGLGLAICRMIVERHGGQLSAARAGASGGARFKVVLPVKSTVGLAAVQH